MSDNNWLLDDDEEIIVFFDEDGHTVPDVTPSPSPGSGATDER